MENQELKKIDLEAKSFMADAYSLGISVILICRFLRELNYDCTITEIHTTLWNFNIFPDNQNCSFDSLTWRRYLISVLGKFEVSTLEQFEELALEEAKDYYNIDDATFTKYWNDFNEFTQEIKLPLDPNWVFHAFHYFGFTVTGLSNMLSNKKGIIATPTEIYAIYQSKVRRHTYSNEENRLRPKTVASNNIREFWKICHKIGKDIDTIKEWTEIFTGTSSSTQEINFQITGSRG